MQNIAQIKFTWTALSLVVLSGLLTVRSAASSPLVEFRGLDFQGGAQAHFSSSYYNREAVNFVYAQPTGPTATMTASFKLAAIPQDSLVIILEAMDDDAPGPCRIRIALNGRSLFDGPSEFPNARWQQRRFAVPPGLLRAGTNELSIINQEPRGELGKPPWFMVARCALAPADYVLPTIGLASLQVRLPSDIRPFPEPLPPGHSAPGFKFRGTKGWGWTPEQYLEEIPVLAEYKMNFLMNCYLSMLSSLQPGAWKNEWWKPLPEAKKEAFIRVFRSCREHGITFCFAVHPQLASSRPLKPSSREDIDQLYQHYAWAQSQGVKWFSVSLDDVSWGDQGPGSGGAAHAGLVNTIFSRLRQQDAQAQLIFCPVPYWGDGTNPDQRAYLEALARDMHPDVYVFWTGDGVVGRRITRKAAQSYQLAVKHRLFLWDNYPVNDGNPTLNLGPVSGRDPDLCELIEGYLSNPMATQNQINRIPLATCADYAYNPWLYDPARSIGQAILHLAKTPAQQETLKQLVETYPGFLVVGGGTGTNPVRTQYEQMAAAPDSRAAVRDFLRKLAALVAQLAEVFPDQFSDARQTIQDDVAWIKGRP